LPEQRGIGGIDQVARHNRVVFGELHQHRHVTIQDAGQSQEGIAGGGEVDRQVVRDGVALVRGVQSLGHGRHQRASGQRFELTELGEDLRQRLRDEGEQFELLVHQVTGEQHRGGLADGLIALACGNAAEGEQEGFNPRRELRETAFGQVVQERRLLEGGQSGAGDGNLGGDFRSQGGNPPAVGCEAGMFGNQLKQLRPGKMCSHATRPEAFLSAGGRRI
jgi:hypothetical protein